MEANLHLGGWIRHKYGEKGKSKFAEKLGVDPTLLSRWLGGKGISEEYQTKIRKMGYTGPWPKEETKEQPAAGITPEQHAREMGRLEGRIEALERQLERLAEGFRHHMTKEPSEAHPQARA